MPDAVPMMAIVDECTLNRLELGALVSSLVSISFPPILLPFPPPLPAIGSSRGRVGRFDRSRDDIRLARFDADPAALSIFLTTELKTMHALDGSTAIHHIGFNGELATSSPMMVTPVPAQGRNTSWMIPSATKTWQCLRPALGIRDGDAVAAGRGGRAGYVAVIDGGIDGDRFDVVDGWSPDGQWGLSDPHGDMVAFDVRAVAPFVKFLDIAALRPHTPKKPPRSHVPEECPTPGKRPPTEENCPNDKCPPRLYDAAEGLTYLSNYRLTTIPGSSLVVCCSWMVLSEPPDLDKSDPTNPGGPEDFRYFQNPNHPFSAMITGLVSSGVPVVFAAGNCGPDGFVPGCDTCNWPVGPGSSIRGANGLESVICVGAADLDGCLLSNSPSGPSTLGTAKPDLCGYAAFDGFNPTGDLGTSAACGVVAGVVAYLQHECPNTTPDAIHAALLSEASTAPAIGSSDDAAYWGAGLVHAGRAREKLCSGTTTSANPPGTGLIQVVDGIVGRSPLSCQRRIRALCENRDKIFRQASLSDQERQAIESLDGGAVTALLKTQLEFALDQAWQGRTSLAERAPDAEDTTIASCGDDRPRLLVNLIADLARSPESQAAFFADQGGFVRSHYALAPDSCALAGSMTRDSCANVSQNAVDEARMDLEIHPQYPSVQSFPGPWIEAFFPDRGQLGDAVAVTIEGRGFVPGRPMMVALFERRIGNEKPKYVCPRVLTVSPRIDARNQALLEKRKRNLDDLCIGVETRKPNEPSTCDPVHGDVQFGGVCKTWPPELGIPELRLGELQLAEDLDLDSAATRFRVEVVFDLREDQVTAGEYDLWVGHCDLTGCQGRAAVGPTTFSVLKKPGTDREGRGRSG
jgi:hypothetical protein